MSAGRWGTGLAATVVLVATGVWAAGPGGVDAHLWGRVRPVIEARLVTDSRGSGYGEAEPALHARWFCRADARDLDEHEGVVRAGVTTLCVEYGVRAGTLEECGGAAGPQVVRLERDARGAYRVVTREEPPDGQGYGRWVADHFGPPAEPDPDEPPPSAVLEAAARTHFGLPADAPVGDC